MGQGAAGLHTMLEAEQSELVGRLLLLTLLMNTPNHNSVSSLGGWITKEHQTTRQCACPTKSQEGTKGHLTPLPSPGSAQSSGCSFIHIQCKRLWK